MISCFVSFDLHVWTQKTDITEATYEHFDLLTRSCVYLPQLWQNFGNFFITRPLSFKILIFQFRMIDCSVCFDSHVWTQKSDIRRATYEHFDLLTRSCVCLRQLWDNCCIFFITHPLSFNILIFHFHMMDWSVSFDSLVWTQTSDITRATYEHIYLLTRFCVCLPQLWHNFGFFVITRSLSFKIFIS